jgi:excisionase family DNA binding protein
MTRDRLLTVREVADRLAVHPDTVRRWVDKGAVAAVRVGPAGTDKPRVRIAEAEAAKLLRR